MIVIVNIMFPQDISTLQNFNKSSYTGEESPRKYLWENWRSQHQFTLNLFHWPGLSHTFRHLTAGSTET